MYPWAQRSTFFPFFMTYTHKLNFFLRGKKTFHTVSIFEIWIDKKCICITEISKNAKKGQAFRSEIQGRTLKLYICQLSKSHKFDAHSIFYLASLHHFGCLISPIEKKQRKINCNAKKSSFLV